MFPSLELYWLACEGGNVVSKIFCTFHVFVALVEILGSHHLLLGGWLSVCDRRLPFFYGPPLHKKKNFGPPFASGENFGSPCWPCEKDWSPPPLAH